MGHAGRPPLHRVPVCLTLDPDIIEWLREAAKKRRIYQSQVIRELILKEMTKEALEAKVYDEPRIMAIVEAVLKASSENKNG